MSIFIADIHSKEAIKGNEFCFKGPSKKIYVQDIQFQRFYVRSEELLNSVHLAKKLKLNVREEVRHSLKWFKKDHREDIDQSLRDNNLYSLTIHNICFLYRII